MKNNKNFKSKNNNNKNNKSNKNNNGDKNNVKSAFKVDPARAQKAKKGKGLVKFNKVRALLFDIARYILINFFFVHFRFLVQNQSHES